VDDTLISMNKKYQTRDGRPVRVLCVDATNADRYPVIALIGDANERLTPYGKLWPDGSESAYDLVEVSE
jgi:hypothetical protein